MPLPSDLGPVPFALELRSEARPLREGRGGRPLPTPAPFGGLLSDLRTIHARGFRGSWTLRLGPLALSLSTQKDLDGIEELWVFLLELVDAGHGEWSLHESGDSEDPLVIEAQRFGPDVNLEFGRESGPPRFRGKALPRRATVRLRALVEEGAALLEKLLAEAASLEPALGARSEARGLREDMQALRDAVKELPRDWRRSATASLEAP
jgi:hypothetical protein